MTLLTIDPTLTEGFQLFRGIPRSRAKQIISEGRLIQVTEVSTLYQQDQPAHNVYLVVESCARYFFLTENGRKIFLSWLGPGALLGASALLGHDSTYLAGVEVGKGTAVINWTRSRFQHLTRTTPVLLENSYAAAFGTVASYLRQHLATVSDTASEKLAKTLLTIAAAVGTTGAGGTQLPITNEQLANTANVTLYTASRHISRWVRDGILDRGRSKIVVRDPSRLAKEI